MAQESNDDPLDAIENGRTCFAAHAKRRLPCLNQTCRMWIDNECNLNCTFIAVCNNRGRSMTLQQIGDIHGLTRMRVCQIEKRAIEKVKESLFS